MVPVVRTGQSLAAQLIQAMGGLSDTTFYLVLGAMAIAVGALLALISPMVHRKMRDAEPDAQHKAAHA